MKRRVVVTGLGAVTPIGNTVPEFWQGIREGRVGIGEIISVCILGSLLLKVLNKYRNVIFRGNE